MYRKKKMQHLGQQGRVCRNFLEIPSLHNNWHQTCNNFGGVKWPCKWSRWQNTFIRMHNFDRPCNWKNQTLLHGPYACLAESRCRISPGQLLLHRLLKREMHKMHINGTCNRTQSVAQTTQHKHQIYVA